MRYHFVPVSVLLTLMLGTAAAATPATPAAMQAYAHQLLDAQKIGLHDPGLAVLVARGDLLLYKGARGAASIELGVPLQPDSLLRIGSVTKQFAAATLLKQIDAGKASLDDPLARFLPDYPNAAHITLRQLLNHTAGVKSYTDIPGYMGNPVRRDLSTAELIKEFKDLPVDFEPGQKWAYNNSGYVLVGAVVEAISGKSWHQTLDEILLKPAQINSVSFESGTEIFKGLAQGYTLNAQGRVAPAGLLSMTQPHAAGALIGNTEGLWRWNQALHGGKLISQASYEHMITPEGAARAANYGYGLVVGQLRGQPMLWHNGGIHGFSSTLNYLPASQTTVVILRNSDGPGINLDQLARKLAAFAIGEPFAEPKAVKLPVEQLKSAEGLYEGPGKQTRTLRVKDGVLQSQRSGGGAAALIPLGGDRFVFPDLLSELRLERDAGGKVVALRVLNNGEGPGDRWVLSGALPAERTFMTLTAAQAQALVGDYASPQFAIRIYIDDKGRLVGQAAGQPALELQASTPRQLHVPSVGAQLDFAAGDGQPSSVTLTQAGQTLVLLRK